MSASVPREQSRFLRNALVLGLLTAIGPFAIDMYLPSLPSIGASLHADPDAVLLSLTSFFLAFAFSQLVYGPVSDMVGRKAPLYVGIGLFAVASVGCALATNIHMLIVFRLIQGLGGAAGMVIARAIVRDLHSGVDEARLLSLLMLVFSVSPLFAPLIGSFLIALADWRLVFWFVTGIALAGIVLVTVFIKETRPPEARLGSSIAGVFTAYRVLFSDRHFLGLSLIGSFAIAGFFVFLANSSFILMGHYHLTPTTYSIAFSVNALAFFAASQLNGWLGARFGLRAMVRPAMVGYAVAVAIMFGLSTSGVDNIFVLGAFLFLSNAFLGLVIPVTSVLALAAHGPVAGTASSLMGTLQLAIGAIVMAVSGGLNDGTVRPMVAGIAVCALVAFVLGVFTLGVRDRVAAKAPAE